MGKLEQKLAGDVINTEEDEAAKGDHSHTRSDASKKAFGPALCYDAAEGCKDVPRGQWVVSLREKEEDWCKDRWTTTKIDRITKSLRLKF